MAEAAKQAGNEAYKEGKYDMAIESFTKALELDNVKKVNSHVYYSNRSAAYLNLGQAQKALVDAEECILLKSDWVKGYSRKGAALFHLRRYEDAVQVYESGLVRDNTNIVLKQGLEEAKKAASAPSSMSAIKTFMMGDKASMFRTVQMIVRCAAFVQVILYAIPFYQPQVFYDVVYVRFFQLCAFNYICCVAWTHGKVQMNTNYAMSLASDSTCHALFYCILMWFAPSSFLTIGPILMNEILNGCFFISILLRVSSSSMLDGVTTLVDPYVGNFIGHPHWSQLTLEKKWTVLKQRIPEISALLTVLIGFSFILELLTPNRSFLRTMMYWQYLRTVYMLSSTLQHAFVVVDGIVLSIVRHPKCPGLFTRGYDLLKKGIAGMTQVQQQGQAASKCSVM